jgi:hypothetical protein
MSNIANVLEKTSPFSHPQNSENEKDNFLHKLGSFLTAGHQKIDESLNRPNAVPYEQIVAQSAQERRDIQKLTGMPDMTLGELPIFSGVGSTPGKVVASGMKAIQPVQKAAVVEEGIALAGRSIASIEKVGALESRVGSAAKVLTKESIISEAGVTSRTTLNLEERIFTSQASTVKGWRVGGPVNNLTSTGKCPKWSTVKKRIWKNEAHWAKSNPHKYGSEDIKRMEEGLPPQRITAEGKLESMECHHVPPQRDGGLFDVIKVWPDEHAKIDPNRFIGG